MLCYFLKVLYIYITLAYGLGPILAYWMVGHIFQYKTSGLCPIILYHFGRKPGGTHFACPGSGQTLLRKRVRQILHLFTLVVCAIDVRSLLLSYNGLNNNVYALIINANGS